LKKKIKSLEVSTYFLSLLLLSLSLSLSYRFGYSSMLKRVNDVDGGCGMAGLLMKGLILV
jgi:hypothetical protein